MLKKRFKNNSFNKSKHNAFKNANAFKTTTLLKNAKKTQKCFVTVRDGRDKNSNA
jgi:hypothetical protein